MDRKKDASQQKIQLNFKNTLATRSRPLQEFRFIPARCIKNLMDDMLSAISRHRQKVRPGRSYQSKSMTPGNKWQGAKAKA